MKRKSVSIGGGVCTTSALAFLFGVAKKQAKKYAMIAYALHGNPPAAKPYPALDKAVVHLLITGKFSDKFSLQDVQKWGESPATESIALKAWRPFSTAAVTKEALASLNEWKANPANRMLTF
ncbi:unnamed protein product [Penicillium palitans]